MVQGRTTSEPVTGSWALKTHWCTWRAKATPSGPITQKSYCSSNYWKLNNLMLATIERCQNKQEFPRWPMSSTEHLNWTMEQWMKFAWSDESCSLLNQLDGWMSCLPEEEMHYGKKADWRVMLWTMFCWKTLGPGIYVTLTCTTYLKIVADHKHPFMAMVLPVGCGLF